MDQNIEIAIRIKPSQQRLISPLCNWDQNSIQVTEKNIFFYDYVLPPESSQQDVFNKIGFKIIGNVLQGYNGCIFTYGQTGSGKTYTMTGYKQQEGIIQRSMRTLWTCVQQQEYFQVKISFFQIYNQTIKDLLNQKQNLTIRQKTKSGFYIQNLTEKVINRFEDFEQLLQNGINNRTIKETKMNQTSSRSHSVLEVQVTYKQSLDRGLDVVKQSKVTFIDLAGSEKQKETLVEGKRLKEAANINKSLSTLSLVISKLSEISQKKPQSSQAIVHIPYRNSVLTKILKNSLTGKSRIIIVCTVSLEDRFLEETISTLRFAQTAKSIKMKVKKNEEQFDGTKDRLFQEFQDIIARFNELKDKHQETCKQNQNLQGENAILKDQVETLQTKINELIVTLESIKVEKQYAHRESLSEMMYIPTQALIQNAIQQSALNYKVNKNLDEGQLEFNGEILEEQQNLLSSQINNKGQNSITQLQFSVTNLSSQFTCINKSVFTIQQANEQSENATSQQLCKLQQKIGLFEKENKKLILQREFLQLQINFKEQQITQLTKKTVFLQAKETQIEDGHHLFSQLIKNKSFDNAQLKFLKLCLQKSQKDRMKAELIQQQKKAQHARINHIMQKVKQLVLKSNYSCTFFQDNFCDNFNFDTREESFNQRSEIGKSNISQTLSKQKKQFERIKLQKKEFVKDSPNTSQRNSKSKNSVQLNRPQESQILNGPFFMQLTNPTNTTPGRQSQISHSVQMFSSFTQQPKMLYSLPKQNSSQASHSSYRFTNNQLQYLKQDHQKLNLQNKKFKGEIDKNKIILLEKQSLLRQKIIQLEQKINENKRLIEEIEIEKYLLDLERTKNCEKNQEIDWMKNIFGERVQELEKKLKDKETQTFHFRQFLQEVQSNHNQLLTAAKLQIKSLKLTKTRHQKTIEEIQAKLSQKEDKLSRISQLQKQTYELRHENERLCREKAFLESENQIFMNEYKKIMQTKNGSFQKQGKLKKVYFMQSLSYTLQQMQNIQNDHLQVCQVNQINEQLAKIIENKRYNQMYKAAYYFHERTVRLEEIKAVMQNKMKEMQFQLLKWNQKGKQFNQQIKQNNEKLLLQSQKQIEIQKNCNHLKQIVVQMKEMIEKKDQIIFQQKHANLELCQYIQLLESKLKESQNRVFQNRQKLNNFSSQVILNPILRASSALSKTPKLVAKERQQYESPDPISSEATVVRSSSYFTNQKSSLQCVRQQRQNQIKLLGDQDAPLFKQEK